MNRAPRVAALLALLGALLFWGAAVASRMLMMVVGRLAPSLAPEVALLARLFYWGSALPGAALLMLMPMSVWGMVGGGRPAASGLRLWNALGASLVTVALYRGQLWMAAGLLGVLATAPVLRARLPTSRPPGPSMSILIRFLWEILLVAPILATGLLSPEPPWLGRLAGQVSGLASGLGPPQLRLLASLSLAWAATAIVARRLYHCARAGRLDPAHVWLPPALLLVASAFGARAQLDAWGGRLLAMMGVGLPVVWVWARRQPRVRVDVLGRVAGRSMASPGYLGALLVGLVFDREPSLALSSALVGASIAIGVIWTQRYHLDIPGFYLPRAARDAARDGALLDVPASLCRAHSGATTGRALRQVEQAVASLLAHRERHPCLKPPPAPILASVAEAGPLRPLLLALTGKPAPWTGPVPEGLRALLWLADARRLLLDLDRDVPGVLAQLELLVASDPSEVRRLTWSVLLARARGHLGQIDGMISDILAVLHPEASNGGAREGGHARERIVPHPRPHMGRDRWTDFLEAQGAPFSEEPGRSGLLSTNVRLEWISALRAEVDRVFELAVTAGDPAALHVLQEQRQRLDEAMAPLEEGASEAFVRRRADRAAVEDLLLRSWLHRWAELSGADDALLADLLRAFWVGGYVPLLARADGEPALAELLAKELATAVHRELRPANPLWENEDWADSLQRRLGDALQRARPGLTPAVWRGALHGPRLESAPRSELACLLDDDLRAGAGAADWMLSLSTGDPRAVLMPVAFLAIRLFPEDWRKGAFDRLTAWLPKPWVDQPDLALLLWEAAEIAVCRLPGGAEEARRLRQQRAWLARRLGDDDDVAQAEGDASGPGLVARRGRAERAEAELLGILEDPDPLLANPGPLLTALERLAGGQSVLDALPDLSDQDALLLQVLAGDRLITVRHDARQTRLTQRPLGCGALLERIDGWRSAMQAGEDRPGAAHEIADALGLADLEIVSGTLHYVGVGPLCRLPLAALPLRGEALGKVQAWIRYDRPSRVPSGDARWSVPASAGSALYWFAPEHPLPRVEEECRALGLWGFSVGIATPERVIAALAGEGPVHLGCHARGGRVDDSDASLLCQDQDLPVSALGQRAVRTPLAYLSSCASALGSLVAGQHPMGITGALLTQGVRHVVSTQWPVDDELSQHVAIRFWRSILARGLSPPAALRAAVQHLSLPCMAWAMIEVHGGQLSGAVTGSHVEPHTLLGDGDATEQVDRP